MRKKWSFLICILLIVCLVLPGCDSKTEEGADTGADADASEPAPADDYEDYIRSAISSVNDAATQPQQTTPAPTQTSDTAPAESPTIDDDVSISSMESPDDADYQFPTKSSSDEDPSLSPTEDPNATPTPTPTPYITPEEFDVGKCCIYINGESDSAFGTEMITAINKARTDLGYSPLISNKSLSTCADRRTREIAANYSHTRPNGLAFYSLAPEHFKAEMLAINNQKAEEVVDLMIKNDPISRGLIFTEKYQSIGASCFKCNGIKYAVVAFGL
ncbi:MAG: hypothetical protein J5367_08025 [Lachnospiraceae bacterium]|nr:hypothetical protein [Lachnospiraceae bacterium]